MDVSLSVFLNAISIRVMANDDTSRHYGDNIAIFVIAFDISKLIDFYPEAEFIILDEVTCLGVRPEGKATVGVIHLPLSVLVLADELASIIFQQFFPLIFHDFKSILLITVDIPRLVNNHYVTLFVDVLLVRITDNSETVFIVKQLLTILLTHLVSPFVVGLAVDQHIPVLIKDVVLSVYNPDLLPLIIVKLMVAILIDFNTIAIFIVPDEVVVSIVLQ